MTENDLELFGSLFDLVGNLTANRYGETCVTNKETGELVPINALEWKHDPGELGEVLEKCWNGIPQMLGEIMRLQRMEELFSWIVMQLLQVRRGLDLDGVKIADNDKDKEYKKGYRDALKPFLKTFEDIANKHRAEKPLTLEEALDVANASDESGIVVFCELNVANGDRGFFATPSKMYEMLIGKDSEQENVGKTSYGCTWRAWMQLYPTPELSKANPWGREDINQ